jgi:hypothetical protein
MSARDPKRTNVANVVLSADIRHSPGGVSRNEGCELGRHSFRLDASNFNDFRPLLCSIRNELSELNRRHRHGQTPKSRSYVVILGSAIAALISLLNLPMISLRVVLGFGAAGRERFDERCGAANSSEILAMSVFSSEPRLRDSRIWPRAGDDWYVEPEWTSHRLFDVETFTGAVHDPACGMGRIVEAARAHRLEATGADLVDRGFGYPVADFLQSHWKSRKQTVSTFDNIVTNPPFDVARAFAEHAVALARRQAAILFPTARLNAARWLAGLPLIRVWLLTPRPSMPPGETILRGERAAGGKTDFAWLVFHRGHAGAPTIGWLRRDGGGAPMKADYPGHSAAAHRV